MTKNILCYGDSNTWGFVPQERDDPSSQKARYGRNQRWTALLQTLLGKKFYIIEEGLNGRTTNLEHLTPPDRNGKNYLPSCLYSHAPIDLVILALGGNDLKTYFKRSATQICAGLAELVDIIQSSQYGKKLQESPKILIVSLAPILPIAETSRDENNILILKGAAKKINRLIGLYKSLAQKKGCYFLDVSKKVLPSEIDGMHLDEKGHQKMAKLLHAKMRSIDF